MDIDWNAQVTGAYCERASPAFWAEPLNAVSSLLVIVIGVFAFAYLWRSRRATPMLLVLMGFAVAIGIGSFLLHTFATRWAELADVLPIWGFVGLYGIAAARSFSDDSIRMPRSVLFAVIVFGAGTALSMNDTLMLSDEISGSTQYLPAAVLIVVVVRRLWKEGHPSLRLIGAAVVLFAVSLALRGLDLPLCELFPAGTHFLWHVANCIVFWLLLSALALQEPARVMSGADDDTGENSRFWRTRLDSNQ